MKQSCNMDAGLYSSVTCMTHQALDQLEKLWQHFILIIQCPLFSLLGWLCLHEAGLILYSAALVKKLLLIIFMMAIYWVSLEFIKSNVNFGAFVNLLYIFSLVGTLVFYLSFKARCLMWSKALSALISIRFVFLNLINLHPQLTKIKLDSFLLLAFVWRMSSRFCNMSKWSSEDHWEWAVQAICFL